MDQAGRKRIRRRWREEREQGRNKENDRKEEIPSTLRRGGTHLQLSELGGGGGLYWSQEKQTVTHPLGNHARCFLTLAGGKKTS